ncbi:MAG TPA: HAD family phosphatase [Burkholderiaceae bacterium]|nr:HAD family phosphatase [Burkholderiaceae bacterium]
MSASPTLRAVAWDVDGTLADSEPLHAAALQAVCAGCGVDLDDVAADAFVGVSITDVWRTIGRRFGAALGSDAAAREAAFYAAVCDSYVARLADLRPRPGAREAVRWLERRGIAQCAVSNSHARIVHANLKALGLAESLRFSLSLEEVEAPKPAPAPYRQACERLALRPAQVAAVEDSESGLASAVAAGLVALFVGPAAPARRPLIVQRLTTLVDLPAWWERQAGMRFDSLPSGAAT